MNLNEAAGLFKQLIDKCPDLEGANVFIEQPASPEVLVDGYEIKIRDKKLEVKTAKYLSDFALEHKLSFELKEDKVAIYKSKPRH